MADIYDFLTYRSNKEGAANLTTPLAEVWLSEDLAIHKPNGDGTHNARLRGKYKVDRLYAINAFAQTINALSDQTDPLSIAIRTLAQSICDLSDVTGYFSDGG